jgi:hypothetical protein
MNKYHIRFNKTRGKPGRGSVNHVWRVFENGNKEYVVKHFKLNVESFDETTGDGQGNDDWNICCYGFLKLDKETSTATIDGE